MKTLNLKKTFKAILLLALVSSCMPQSNRVVQSSQVDEESNTPTYTSSLNNWESAGLSSYSSLSIYTDYNSSLLVKGKEIDHYIRTYNKYAPECLVGEYPNSLSNKLLAIAAFPVSTYDYDTKTYEYYYRVEPNNKASNIAFCQTAGLIGQMNVVHPGYGIAYSADTLCATCTTSYLQSTGSTFYTTAGIEISTIGVSYLKLNLQVQPASSSSATTTCTSSNYCQSLGYDCCSEQNQCIVDGTLKPNATSSLDYDSAVLSEQNNPGSYRNWPSVYNVCPISVSPTATPIPDIDHGQLIDDHLQMLKELYECTTPQHAEMAICTVTYKDVTSNPVSFITKSDDRNFSTTYTGEPLSYAPGIVALPGHSIYEVNYGGTYLYKDRAFTVPGSFVITGGNDSIASTDYVTLNSLSYTLSASAPSDDLKIRYRVDGSCEAVSDDIAKCYKIYVQGQNIGEVDDHYPASQTFLIPKYANLSKSLKVEVNDEFTTKWTLNNGASPYIDFNSTQTVYDSQTVKITFYVDTSGGLNQVMKSKIEALDKINELCSCGGPYCALEPQTQEVNGVNVIYNYKCVYPEVDTQEAPQYQEIYMSSKTVPHRLFDSQGVSQAEMDSTITQEGTAFEYINGDQTKPNNESSYIGFNEIYGSFRHGGNGAVPAKEIRVTANTTYDIYTNSGNFSSCLNCGTDYYSQLVKIFPENFFYKGGGYSPDPVTTNRTELLSQYPYRSDDHIFGRACWLPATMIPWSHRDFSDGQYQRLKRLQTQHFFFANGYQRDWYGFDYGALIGSFDGVFWFAIGNKRRIKATTNRLYLAINAYFGDLTSENSYHVTIADATLNQTLGDEVTNDFYSDGAECRKYHTCQSDADCISQLGWEYTCQNITGIKSQWPKFDSSGNELPEEDDYLRSIFSRIGSSVGGTSRCVYRGMGAPCHQDYFSQTSETSYSHTDKPGLNGCANNFYCQPFSNAGYDYPLFNNRINRAARSVQYMNAVNGNDNHTFGKGAKQIGRPYNYHGTNTIDSDVESNLTNNRVTAMCLPGRNAQADTNNNGTTTLHESNQAAPMDINNGDQVLAMGMTPTESDAGDPMYLNSCSVLSDSGNLHIFRSSLYDGLTSLATQEISDDASSQIIPSNALKIFENSTDVFSGGEIIDHFREDGITSPIIQENSCLRAPGSVCHTDTDCAPSEIITRYTNQVDDNTDYVNNYELKFWQETMICGQSEPRMIGNSPNPEYDLTQNRCCRETGKTLTIATEIANYNTNSYSNTPTNGVSTDPSDILGASINFSSSGISTRYSRISTVAKKSKDTPEEYPQLRTVRVSPNPTTLAPTSGLKNQYRTFSYIAQNSCCSGNWVREFHRDDNGGGHLWAPNKAQNIEKSNFKCLNWLPKGSNGGDEFECPEGDATSEECINQSRHISISEGNKVFEFMNSLELAGIPQAIIKIPDITETYGAFCRSSDTQGAADATDPVMPGTISTLVNTNAEYTDGTDYYFSAADDSNFDSQLKNRFSADEISCCIPAGEPLQENGSASDCCTGYVGSNGLCALKDYTDVSLFFNRYVSSAAKGLSEALFDEETGFIKDPEVVMNLACTNRVCESDTVALGISLSLFAAPGSKDNELDNRVRNFVDRNGLECSYSEYYDAGLKWNTNVYCVPAEVYDIANGNPDCNFTIRSCAAFYSN